VEAERKADDEKRTADLDMRGGVEQMFRREGAIDGRLRQCGAGRRRTTWGARLISRS